MAIVDAALVKIWRQDPERLVSLIVHVAGSVEERAGALQAMGIQVKRRFRLTGAISVRCKAEAAIKLANTSWVRRLEPDRPVRAVGR